ncbi:hypothetical protein [Granulicella tundricola]|uniref:Uncharacterized protein n=1 Tax=Granulicella tundricola (strain ATCC BAA-1859 / DSM 23138 / MP5ACTX9) TaxID=1198114 RepID=E8WW21_GRATM|nr:hypothetical protein [Granulicella tundricola]ADW67327.1 hypothetical protein AciX9_0253 [Granulicella tundricola MP5ACTX9]
MTLLNAPAYNERKERTIKATIIGSGLLVALIIIIGVGGFLVGHGWFFSNLPAEHRVSTFFDALEANNYDKAFGIYTNDADWKQHPDQHKDYGIDRFTEDWTKDSPADGPIISHHVDISKTDGTGNFGSGIIVAVRVNSAKTQNKKLFMYYVRKDGTLTWPAFHQLEY